MKKQMDQEKRMLIAGGIGILVLATVIGLYQANSEVQVSLNTSDASKGEVEYDMPSLSDKTKKADAVVVATATGSVASLKTNEFGDKLVYTKVDLKINETLKGSVPGTLQLEMIGGTLPNGLTLKVENFGSASPAKPLKAGERAVLFLKSVNGKYEISEGEQGLIGLDKANNATDGTNLTLNQLKAGIGAGK